MARKARKIKDKWKEKKWVTVIAPDSFNDISLGYVPITDDEKAKGRVLEVTLHDILKGDPSQHQYKIFFQIEKVVDEKARTIFKWSLNQLLFLGIIRHDKKLVNIEDKNEK